MLLLLVPAAIAEEFEAIEGWEAVPSGWDSNNMTNISLVKDEVDGAEQTVLKWQYYNSETWLKYPVGKLEPGTYVISVYIKSPNNMGDSRFGITQDSNGAFFDNSPGLFFPQFNNEYVMKEREVTVTEEQADVGQNMELLARYGDTGGYSYIAGASMKKKNNDGTYGPELIGDFKTVKASDNYWTVSSSHGYEIIRDNVNGEIKNVLKVSYKNGNGTTIYADIKNGSLEAGTYRISITTKSPNNAGESFWGITLTDEGGFPDNSKNYTTWANWSDMYSTITRDIVVTSSNVKQQLMFKTGWGDDNCPLYIADVKIQRVYDDGILGENRIINPDFTVVETESGAYPVTEVKSWPRYHGSLEFTEADSFTVRNVMGKDGAETRALVGYKAANNTGIRAVAQTVPTEAGKTYRLTYDFKQIGAVLNFGTRINSAMQGDFYETFIRAASPGATEWTTKTCDYVMQNSDVIENLIAFSLEGQCFEGEQLVYIDNVKFQEVIDENTLGPNLIANGDFEARSYQTALMFDIYDDTGTSVTGGEGFGKIPDFSLDALGYKMVAKAAITNGESETITPVFIVAVYDGAILKGMEIVTASIAGGATEEWIGVAELPDSVGNGNVTAKAFVWENLKNLKPLSGVEQVFEE